MDTNDLEKLAQQAGLLTPRASLLTFQNRDDFLPKLGRFMVLYQEQMGTQAGIHRATLEAKIAEFLDTEDDHNKGETYMTDRQLSKNRLDAFMAWLYKDDIERDKRYAEFLKLKAEFEPEEPRLNGIVENGIRWRRTGAGAYVASKDDRDVANVWPSGERWIGQRWTRGTSAAGDARPFDSREDAMRWAVGHL